MRNPEQFKALGLTAPAGVLLAGPPGCGKTLLAKVTHHTVSYVLRWGCRKKTKSVVAELQLGCTSNVLIFGISSLQHLL